jgi:DNA mismatch repair protein MutS
MLQVKKLLTTIIFISSLFQTCQPNLYQEIAQENLKSLTKIELEEKPDALSALITQEKEWYDVLQERLEEQLNPPVDSKRKAVFNLFSQYEKENPLEPSKILDLQTWQDLEILCGPQSNPTLYLAAKVDRTVTEVGKATLFKKIVQPTADIQKLITQQKITHELLKNESLFNELNTKLEPLKTPESAILSFWKEDIFESCIKEGVFKLPFSNKVNFIKTLEHWINRNEYLIEFKDKQEMINMAIWPTLLVTGISIAALSLSAKLTGNKYLTKADTYLHDEKRTVLNKLHLQDFDNSIGYSILGLSLVAMKYFFTNKLTTSAMTTFGVTKIGWQLWYFPMYMKCMLTYRRCIQTKLIHVATYINSAKEILTIIEQNKKLSSLMPEIQGIESKIEELKTKSQDLQHLLDLLSKNTFKGKASFFSLVGRVFAAYRMMCEIKDQLVPMMVAIGELDTQMSIAKLYKEFETQSLPFCFPAYLEPEKELAPSINIEDFWYPVIDQEKAVTNSLSLGTRNGKSKNIIITGPNAGGKSTTIKALVCNLILAQSLGIAPSQELTFTPFERIVSYLNITDDIAAGNSHFKAGVMRARELIETTKLEPNQFSFTTIDEVFNGTTFKEGQAAAYSLIKALGLNEANICTTCTHFPIISTLEKETGVFDNYKVSIFEDSTGKINYPYKLESGISDQIITFKILKEEGFGDEFLSEAQRVLLLTS